MTIKELQDWIIEELNEDLWNGNSDDFNRGSCAAYASVLEYIQKSATEVKERPASTQQAKECH